MTVSIYMSAFGVTIYNIFLPRFASSITLSEDSSVDNGLRLTSLKVTQLQDTQDSELSDPSSALHIMRP